jgi:hypothetical protein
MCFNRQSEFVGRLILLRGNDAGGILDERVLADVTAEGVAGSAPCGPGCHIVGVEKQTAHRVAFTVCAFRTPATHKLTAVKDARSLLTVQLAAQCDRPGPVTDSGQTATYWRILATLLP